MPAQVTHGRLAATAASLGKSATPSRLSANCAKRWRAWLASTCRKTNRDLTDAPGARISVACRSAESKYAVWLLPKPLPHRGRRKQPVAWWSLLVPLDLEPEAVVDRGGTCPPGTFQEGLGGHCVEKSEQLLCACFPGVSREKGLRGTKARGVWARDCPLSGGPQINGADKIPTTMTL